MSDRSGGEPLSPEQAALIEKLAPLAREAVVAEQEHARIHREKGGHSPDDAEANQRECRADDAWLKATVEVDDAALIDGLIRSLLASQERCKQLAEALDAVLDCHTTDSDHCRFCEADVTRHVCGCVVPAVRIVLLAYRSSEAGKEK